MFFMGDIRALLFASGNDPGDDTGERQDRHENSSGMRSRGQWEEDLLQEEMNTSFMVTAAGTDMRGTENCWGIGRR